MWTLMNSPVGELRIVKQGGAISAIEFSPFRESTGRPLGDRDDAHPVLAEAVRQLTAYFDHDLKEFDLPLAPQGTSWQKSVCDQLLLIGYGETASYGQIAARLGKSNAASRAVGTAKGSNPIPIVIPCHRVIGANGTLTGYAGGLPRKQTLLELEQELSSELVVARGWWRAGAVAAHGARTASPRRPRKRGPDIGLLCW